MRERLKKKLVKKNRWRALGKAFAQQIEYDISTIPEQRRRRTQVMKDIQGYIEVVKKYRYAKYTGDFVEPTEPFPDLIAFEPNTCVPINFIGDNVQCPQNFSLK